jgi:hypothetical protein
MMTDWYERSMKALQLNGLGTHTQGSYTRAVRMLCEFYSKTPTLSLRKNPRTSSTAETLTIGRRLQCGSVTPAVVDLGSQIRLTPYLTKC